MSSSPQHGRQWLYRAVEIIATKMGATHRAIKDKIVAGA